MKSPDEIRERIKEYKSINPRYFIKERLALIRELEWVLN
jgi:hypothetical protein